jgi:hypothetical protein
MNHFDLNLDNLRIQWLVYWLKQSIKVILNHNNTRLTILYSAMTEKSTLFKFFEYFCCHNDQVVVWAVILIFPYFHNILSVVERGCVAGRSRLPTWQVRMAQSTPKPLRELPGLWWTYCGAGEPYGEGVRSTLGFDSSWCEAELSWAWRTIAVPL